MKKKTQPPKSYLQSPRWLFLGLGLLILISYSNSLTAALLFDSEIIIKLDPRIRELNRTNIHDILTRSYWWPTQEGNLYRPVTTFSYLFNYAILGNGENVAGYHILNLVLHWANACLLFVIITAMGGTLALAVLAASLFALHPVNTEAVTNVVGRADLLATFFVLLGAWCYLRAKLRTGQSTKWLFFTGATACAGVLAKENAVAILAFVFVYEVIWQRLSWRSYAALAASVGLIIGVREWVSSSTFMFEEFFLDNPLAGASPFLRFMTGIGIMGRYLKLLIWPRTLSPDYSFNQIPLYGTGNSTSDVSAWLSLLVIGLVVAAAVCGWKRHKIFSWGVLFFFAALLPTSNLILTIGSNMAERFLYLPSIGFAAAAAVIILAISGKVALLVPMRSPAGVRWVLPVVIITMMAVRTFARNLDWHDDIALWRSAVAAAPGSYKAHMIYGNAILGDAEGKGMPLQPVIGDAIREEEIARSIVETEPPLPMKWQNLTVYLHLSKDYRIKGRFLEQNGQHDQAAKFFGRSLEAATKAQDIDRFTNQASREFRVRRGISPEQIPDIGNPLVYESLCFTYGELGEWQKCEPAAHYLQHIAPQQTSGYQMLGAAYFNLGRYSDAAAEFLAGMLVDPGKPEWLSGLSTAYEKIGLEPNPVAQQADRLVLNTSVPFVNDELQRAATRVLQLYREAGKIEEARDLRDRIVKTYGLSAQSLPGNS